MFTVSASLELLRNKPPTNINGRYDPAGKFCKNPIQYSMLLAEKTYPVRELITADGAPEMIVQIDKIWTDQKVIIKEKVERFIVNPYLTDKLPLCVRFEGNESQLMLFDGNHRAAATWFRGVDNILVNVIDFKDSFRSLRF